MNLKKVHANQNLGQDISRKHNDPVEVGTGERMGSDDGEETEAEMGGGVGWGGRKSQGKGGKWPLCSRETVAAWGSKSWAGGKDTV